MSRKQEIYRDILSWALPSTRNCLSWFRNIHPFALCFPKWRRALREQHAVAEFVHNLYETILQEEFVRHDIDFLNYIARSFFERNKNALEFPVFAFYIQELFKEVPEEMRHQLLWDGPQDDYSHLLQN